MEEITIKGKPFELYLTAEQIEERVRELAKEINAAYQGIRPVVMPVLNGAFMFAADLIRHLVVRPEIQFVKVSTYGTKMESSGQAQLLLGLDEQLKGRHVLLIEDIVDSGYTAEFLRNQVDQHQPASVKMVTLLFKPELFQSAYKPEFVGFEIPPEFVVGYGLDFAHEGREWPGIYRLKS
jgi:hypoxanthine phosphoribosyltransferase